MTGSPHDVSIHDKERIRELEIHVEFEADPPSGSKKRKPRSAMVLIT